MSDVNVLWKLLKLATEQTRKDGFCMNWPTDNGEYRNVISRSIPTMVIFFIKKYVIDYAENLIK